MVKWWNFDMYYGADVHGWLAGALSMVVNSSELKTCKWDLSTNNIDSDLSSESAV